MSSLSEHRTSADTGRPTEAHLIDATIICRVLDWGETVTDIRLHYDDEIYSGAVRHDRCFETFGTSSPMSIEYLYVNNSGEPDDIGPFGKYVFIHFARLTADYSRYTSAVTYNPSSEYRDKVCPIVVWQNQDIRTKSGKIARAYSEDLPDGGGYIVAEKERRVDLEPFQYHYFTTVEGINVYYMIHVPEKSDCSDAAQNALPLIVHCPSMDYKCKDYEGKYTGALYRHPDATLWASSDVQKRHPCFVVTLGADKKLSYSLGAKVYATLIFCLCSQYRIDPNRIYGCSIGGGGALLYELALNYPDIFAGWLMASFDPLYYECWFMGGNNEARTKENVRKLMKQAKFWIFASARDRFGPEADPEECSRGIGKRLIHYGKKWSQEGLPIDVAFGEDGEFMWNGLLNEARAEEQAICQISRGKQKGICHFISLYIPNTIKGDDHCSWVPAFTNKGVQDWLFSIRKE